MTTVQTDALPTVPGGVLEPQSSEALVDLREGAMRFLALAFMTLFVYRGVNHLVIDPSRINILMLTISEVVTFTWLTLSRRPKVRDWDPLTVVISLTASFGFGFVSLGNGIQIVPLDVAAPMQFLAIWMAIWGKMSLGRSFAILPANRGVVTTGAYMYIRHPIYAGYLTGHVFFLLSSFSLYNLAIYTIITMFQIYRMTREERILAQEPEYREYLEKVRYRIMPGVF